MRVQSGFVHSIFGTSSLPIDTGAFGRDGADFGHAVSVTGALLLGGFGVFGACLTFGFEAAAGVFSSEPLLSPCFKCGKIVIGLARFSFVDFPVGRSFVFLVQSGFVHAIVESASVGTSFWELGSCTGGGGELVSSAVAYDIPLNATGRTELAWNTCSWLFIS